MPEGYILFRRCVGVFTQQNHRTAENATNRVVSGGPRFHAESGQIGLDRQAIVYLPRPSVGHTLSVSVPASERSPGTAGNSSEPTDSATCSASQGPDDCRLRSVLSEVTLSGPTVCRKVTFAAYSLQERNLRRRQFAGK